MRCFLIKIKNKSKIINLFLDMYNRLFKLIKTI